MDDELGTTIGSPDLKGGSRLAQWGRRLETTKVGPGIVVGFIALLGVFCLAAAGVGYLIHHLPGR